MKVLINGMHGCTKCKQAIDFCNENGIEYEYSTDMQITIEKAKIAGLREAPIIEFENELMSFDEFRISVKEKIEK